MSQLLFGHDQTVADWVATKIGKKFYPPFAAFGAINRDGLLSGGAVFTNYTGDAVEMSIAGSATINRGFLASIVAYVFDQLGCSRLSVHTNKKNKVIRKIAPKIGFKFEGTARRMYGESDGYCYSLTKDDLPKLKERWKI